MPLDIRNFFDKRAKNSNLAVPHSKKPRVLENDKITDVIEPEVHSNSEDVDDPGSSVEKPRIAKRQKNRDNQPSDSVEEYFRRALAVPLLDNLIMELNVRFDSVSQTVIKLLNLIPSVCANEEKDKNNVQLQDLVDLYEADLPNPALVEVEYEIWRKKWKKVEAEDRPDTLAKSIKQMDEVIFPNLFILMKIACTLPVASCECERSFSCFRRLRTWLRASMGMPRLSALALMNIRYDWNINYRKAAELFLKLHPRKIKQPSLFFA